jgi:hypothetical protein
MANKGKHYGQKLSSQRHATQPLPVAPPLAGRTGGASRPSATMQMTALLLGMQGAVPAASGRRDSYFLRRNQNTQQHIS